MVADSPSRLLLFVVTVSFLSVVATLVATFGTPGLLGVGLAVVLSSVVLALLRSLRRGDDEFDMGR